MFTATMLLDVLCDGDKAATDSTVVELRDRMTVAKAEEVRQMSEWVEEQEARIKRTPIRR